jgi:phosphoribosylformylglycinamidine cyclo-ligase
VGLVPAGRRPLSGSDLRPGDDIVLVASTGLHTNGASLARAAVRRIGALTHELPDGTTLGDALLAPSAIYVSLMERVLNSTVELVYASHITGHGLRKVMRAQAELTYRITRLPEVPSVLELLVSTLEMSAEDAYAIFNMGAGFALYCRPGHGSAIVEQASEAGHVAWVAGRVESGPREVVLEPLGLTYSDAELRLR